ncbi:MAG: hypothetical protein HQL71_07910 [Magnetococcales bacterium]|nr:hypothetical protein [Magnetococcales bacterium]
MALFFMPDSLFANEVTIVKAHAVKEASNLVGGGRSFTFLVTLRHNDTGWKHYANRWEIWTPDNKLKLGARVLAHPHVNEQPFTRSLQRVTIPLGIKDVLIKAGDTVHGISSTSLLIKLPAQ